MWLIAYINNLDWKREKTTSAMFISPCQRQPGLPRPWFQLKIMKKSILQMPALKEEHILRSGKAKLQLLASFTLPLGSAWHERGEGKSGESREVTNRLLEWDWEGSNLGNVPIFLDWSNGTSHRIIWPILDNHQNHRTQWLGGPKTIGKHRTQWLPQLFH